MRLMSEVANPFEKLDRSAEGSMHRSENLQSFTGNSRPEGVQTAAEPPSAPLLDDHGRNLPPWREQVTWRGMFISALIAVIASIMTLK